jgi:hypothetical protein
MMSIDEKREAIEKAADSRERDIFQETIKGKFQEAKDLKTLKDFKTSAIMEVAD